LIIAENLVQLETYDQLIVQFSMQRSDLISVIQRNGGHVQALLAALARKECEQRYPPMIAWV